MSFLINPYSFLSTPAIDADAQAYFNACTTAGASVTGAYINYYNNTIIALKASSQWTELDSLFIDATGNRTWALIDVKTPSRTATVSGAYGGDWTTGLGFKGDGTGFGIVTNFNPTVGTNKYLQNSASFGALLLDNNSVVSNWDLGAANGGYTNGDCIRAYNETTGAKGAGGINSGLFGVYTYQKPIINSYCWIGWNRTGGNRAYNYYNGVNIEQNEASSVAIINQPIARFGAYNGAFAGGFYSANRQACFYAGSGSVSQNLLMNALNTNFFVPQATKAATTKRIIFEGDSRLGDQSTPTLSNTYGVANRALSNLGNNWVGVTVSANNQRTDQMATQYSTEIAPYLNTSLLKNIFVLWAGTNDIAANRTAAQIKTDIETICNAAKAQGYTVIIVGEIDRNWTSYAAMNTVRATLRTSMLADFGVSTVVGNVFTPASVTYANYYIDLYSEANFQSYVSAYYQADGVHPNTTGSNKVGDYISSTINI